MTKRHKTSLHPKRAKSNSEEGASFYELRNLSPEKLYEKGQN